MPSPHTKSYGINLLVDPPELLVAYFKSIEASPEGREPAVVRGLLEDIVFVLDTRFAIPGDQQLTIEQRADLAAARQKLRAFAG